ncbi:alcohol dehydrogenase catalytic domain-containing protein, partial [bacterium]|nr:alcohol dehydrogenase catalytic domain-containing protein [bacterium]
MQAAYLTKPKQFAIREFPSQEPKPDEILIRVEYTGVCGSDLHFYESGRIGEVVLSYPFVM